MNNRKIGIMLSYINIIIHIIMNFLYVPILIHYIGKNEYGLYQLIGTFIGYFILMDFGLTTAVVRFYTKYKTLNDNINMENVLAISVRCYNFIAVILFIIGVCIYFNFDNIFANSMTVTEISSAKKLLLLLLFNVVLTMSTMIFRAVINAYERFLFLKGLETVQLLMQPILIILILENYPTAFSVALVQTIINIILDMTRGYYCIRVLRIKIKYHYWNKNLIKPFKNLALSVFMVTIVEQIFFKSNQIILGIISGTAAVAVYSLASLIYISYLSMSTAISNVYLPYLTQLFVKNNNIRYLSDFFIKIGRWQYFLLALVCSGFIIFGKEFIVLWAGDDFREAYLITIIIIIPFTIELIQNIGITILQAQNRYNFRARVYFCMGIFNLCLAIPLGLKYGGIGCAFATGLSMFIGNGLIMNWYYLKVMGLNIALFWKNISKISIGVIIITIVAYTINTVIFSLNIFVFVIKLIIYTSIYVLVMYKLFMNVEEKEKIKNLVRKFI